jgi:hypothetical protein
MKVGDEVLLYGKVRVRIIDVPGNPLGMWTVRSVENGRESKVPRGALTALSSSDGSGDMGPG